MIVGIVNWNKNSEITGELARMKREVGPFPVGEWESSQASGVAMAASETGAITGPARLLRNDGKSLVAVFDGVIYNRAEIIQLLDVSLLSPVPGTGKGEGTGKDKGTGGGGGGEVAALNAAEILVAGYRRWGRDVLDHLVGDFAFALWDEEAHILFAAVDPFGLRPCYFAVGDGRLAFGSRMSQLRPLPWVGSGLNERMVVSFLLDAFDDPFVTFYANIKQLPGGHYLWADGKRLTIARYWRPGVRHVCRATRRDEVLEEFADRFRQAVRLRLDERQATGILMSGGLDSTALAGMTADICNHGANGSAAITVICALFGDLPCDETSYIEAALRRLPFASRKIDGRNGHYDLDDLQKDLRRHEWPVLHRQGPLFNGFREAARSCGARILLNGLGGDELTTDYRYYAVPMNGSNRLGLLRAAHLVSQVERMSLGKSLYLLSREACPEEIKRPYRWLRRRVRSDPAPGWTTWLGPKYRRVADELTASPEPTDQGFGSETLELAWRILTSPGAAWANRFLVDEFAADGIQCRFPFLDRRLFDLVFSVPRHLRPRCRGRPWFKPYIAQGLAACIPPEIRRRDAKVDFEAYNCFVLERCLNFLFPILFGGNTWISEPYVPRSLAFALFHEFRQTHDDRKTTYETRKRMGAISNIAGLELWLRGLNQ
jgi:asparagine synthase (glutamine-hydrolysing)